MKILHFSRIAIATLLASLAHGNAGDELWWDLTYAELFRTHAVPEDASIRSWMEARTRPLPNNDILSAVDGEIESALFFDMPDAHAERFGMLFLQTKERAVGLFYDQGELTQRCEIPLRRYRTLLRKAATWQGGPAPGESELTGPRAQPWGVLSVYQSDEAHQTLLSVGDMYAADDGEGPVMKALAPVFEACE